MKNVQQVAEGLKKVKKAIDKFEKEFRGVMPDELGIVCMVALIKDKTLFIEKVNYSTIELSLNAESIEKSVIYKKLSEKYAEKDKIEQEEQKKLIHKQVEEIRKKNKEDKLKK